MPAPSFILFFGGEFLLFSIFSALDLPNPCKISSQPKGAPVRPGTYMVIEDVIAVDTGAGRAYRKAINDRYEASPMFRKMLWQLNLFWAIPALAVGVGVTAAVADNRVPQTVAYGIGMIHYTKQFSASVMRADLVDRLGRTSDLGGHMGLYHDTMGASSTEKRERRLAQGRQSVVVPRQTWQLHQYL
jgi:hypothetical protein